MRLVSYRYGPTPDQVWGIQIAEGAVVPSERLTSRA